MKKLFPILLLFLSWLKPDLKKDRPYGTHIICAGSGACSVTSMSGFSPGDVLEVATQTGVYTSFTFDNLFEITIIAQSGRPVFTTGGQATGNNAVDISGIDWNSTNGTSIDMTGGRNFGLHWHNCKFSNFPGSVITANGNLLYTYHDTTTYKWFHCIFDSITLFQNGFFIQGSFGSPSDNSGSPPDVFAHCTFTRFLDDATTATFEPGKEVHGICFGCIAHDWTVTSPSSAPNGDDALVYGWGSWTVYNFYKNGGNGYLVRLFPMQEAWDPTETDIYNSGKFNSQEYGAVNLQFDTTGTISTHFFGTDGKIYNISGGNFADHITYWCPIINNGQVATNRHYVCANCMGFNLVLNGKSPIYNNLGGWNTIASDTSHGQYWATSAIAKLDSAYTIITTTLGPAPAYRLTALSPGILLHGGVTNPFTSVDFLGNAMRVPPDLGYIQFSSTPPPPGCPSCIPLRWNTIAH
jgi:hypothetical protein